MSGIGPLKSASVALIVILGISGFAAQQPDASVLLAAARQALGGDAKLKTVTSLSVTGSMTQDSGPVTIGQSVEFNVVLPDKFLRTTRRTMQMGPLGSFDITDYSGFNGTEPIHDTVAPGAPFPVVIPAGPPPVTSAEIAAAKQRQLAEKLRLFVETLIPLFATLPPASPTEFQPAGQAQLPSGTAHVLTVKSADGFTWRLFLDGSTSLPVRLTWMSKPIVVRSTSSVVTTSSSGSPSAPAIPPPPTFGDPTAGLADVEWVMEISDYKVADGLNWPHRFITTVGGRKYQDMRLGKFKINPKIDERKFRPR